MIQQFYCRIIYSKKNVGYSSVVEYMPRHVRPCIQSLALPEKKKKSWKQCLAEVFWVPSLFWNTNTKSMMSQIYMLFWIHFQNLCHQFRFWDFSSALLNSGSGFCHLHCYWALENIGQSSLRTLWNHSQKSRELVCICLLVIDPRVYHKFLSCLP
jgi:hypothetical protein